MAERILINEKYRSCIDACSECVEACEMCMNLDLKEEKMKPLETCIRTNRDCADICALAVKFMSRDSSEAPRICGVCAEICDACARECERHELEHCKICAEVCRRCAEECRSMAVGM
jgi:hypothetical protein